MRWLAVLVALAGVARAGDRPNPTFPIAQIATPPRELVDEVRFVPHIGQVWRFGPRVVVYDGAWWEVAAVSERGDPMGEHTEIDDAQARLDVIVRGGRVALAVTANAKQRVCNGADCDEITRISNRIVCWRDSRMVCAFENLTP